MAKLHLEHRQTPVLPVDLGVGCVVGRLTDFAASTQKRFSGNVF